MGNWHELTRNVQGSHELCEAGGKGRFSMKAVHNPASRTCMAHEAHGLAIAIGLGHAKVAADVLLQ